MSEKSREQMIHEATMQIMAEVGVMFDNDRAIEILKENGIKVEGNVAYFTEEQVMKYVDMAPEQFTIYARNPKYDVTLGDGTTNHAPAYGCAFLDDWDGNRTSGGMAEYMKALKLVEAEDSYKINGGILIQPRDVPEEHGAELMYYAMLTHTEKALLLPTGYIEEMQHIMDASCAAFGGKDALIEKPRMIALINTVSPLRLDGRMLDCLMLLAEYGQPAILCPAAMLGATSSITMAGTIAAGAAESLAGICLAQMIRQGTPVVFGIQSTAADMRGGMTFACAAPEGTIMQGFSANMGRFYHLPSRGGGCQTDAPVINCQAGYESMLTFFAASHHGINIVMEAGGIVDSVNATSFEKMIVDFEIIRQVRAALTPFVVDEETLNLEEIEEIGQEGTFVTAESTLDNFSILYNPKIGSRNAKTPDYFKESIDKEMQRLLDKYENSRPQLDAELKAAIDKVYTDAGIGAEQLQAICDL